ncbi:elongation of fatty acids protein 3-like [Citrus clementina]|uniref:elongation of fatty acids protein 3-like n=1 Tax=Citrus clementina TaxID=85681 RepID=UPI000CED0DD1|nr:elongation of fatty acids protein 3-like [Citrus x clementina]
MASYSITATLQYWLVNHPKILNFTWTQNQTLASSPHFLILSILTYLSLTFILYHTSTSTSPPSSPFIGPHILKPITAVHNLTLLLLSLIMAVGCTLSIILHLPHLHCTLCFPPTISPSGPLFFYPYIFYLSKILQFLDTLLIILSNSVQRLTFLHVYHHATVVVMCFLWLQTKQSLASSQIHQ